MLIGGDPMSVLENGIVGEVISMDCASCSVLEWGGNMKVFENGAPQKNVIWYSTMIQRVK